MVCFTSRPFYQFPLLEGERRRLDLLNQPPQMLVTPSVVRLQCVPQFGIRKRAICLQPLIQELRQHPVDQLESGYLCATARHLLEQATQEAFWKSPPSELEDFESSLIAFVRQMMAESRRLGVFVSRATFNQRSREGAWDEFRGPRGRHRTQDGFNRRVRIRDTHFATLGLEATASLTDVKSAYREMVKQHHPDQGGTVQDFLQLQEAYEFLLTEVF